MIIRAAICAALLAGAASGQSLSPSEEAALSEREATVAETARRQLDCELLPEFLGQKQIADGVIGSVVKLPDLSFLTIMQMVYAGAEQDTFEVRAFDDIPNGGIAAFDFCNVVSLDTFIQPTQAGQITRLQALQLRQGLDLEQDYPNTSKYLTDNALVVDVPKGTYVLVDTSDPVVSEWYSESGGTWAAQNADGPGIGFGMVLALRVSD